MISAAQLDDVRRRLGLQPDAWLPRISFALTLPQCRARTKTETRRNGHGGRKVGDVLLAVDRVMGFRRGERIDDVVELLGVIRLLEVRREPLADITPEAVAREGFPDLSPAEFTALYRKGNRMPANAPRVEVTVLRFAWLCDDCGSEDAEQASRWCIRCGRYHA